jgi:hypothetical protein
MPLGVLSTPAKPVAARRTHLHCGLLLGRELALHVLQGERRLADAALAQEDHLEIGGGSPAGSLRHGRGGRPAHLFYLGGVTPALPLPCGSYNIIRICCAEWCPLAAWLGAMSATLPPLLAVGALSGTSVDGIDCALIEAFPPDQARPPRLIAFKARTALSCTQRACAA